MIARIFDSSQTGPLADLNARRLGNPRLGRSLTGPFTDWLRVLESRGEFREALRLTQIQARQASFGDSFAAVRSLVIEGISSLNLIIIPRF